jgi:hypothetical protein
MPKPPSARGRGRPSGYTPQHAERAYHACLLGADNSRLADVLGVDRATVARWMSEHEDFCASVKRGKEIADEKVAKSLYRRALGYRHKAVKIFADAKTGAVVEVPYVEHYPPDTTAGIFWLKNRRPDVWRDRHQFEFDVTGLGDEQLARIVAGEDPVKVAAEAAAAASAAQPANEALPVQ